MIDELIIKSKAFRYIVVLKNSHKIVKQSYKEWVKKQQSHLKFYHDLHNNSHCATNLKPTNTDSEGFHLKLKYISMFTLHLHQQAV